MIIQSPDELHLELLRLIEANPEITQRELARVLGISLGRVNYCLQALREKGWVKIRNFTNSSHKLAYAYYLSPAGIEAKARATLRFLRAKLAERDRLIAEIEQLRMEVESRPRTDENESASTTIRRIRT